MTGDEILRAAVLDLIDTMGPEQARAIMEEAIAKYAENGGATVIEYLLTIRELQPARQKSMLH